MPLIDAARLHEIMKDCLYTEEEQRSWDDPRKPPEDAVLVEGLVRNFGLHPGRLESHRTEIEEMLLNLDRRLMQSTGGGHTFMSMPFDKNGEQWCEQPTAEELLVLGIGLKKAGYCMPREIWAMFPGGVPYVVIFDREREPADNVVFDPPTKGRG